MSEAPAKKEFTAERQRLRRLFNGKPKKSAGDITNAELLQAIVELRDEFAALPQNKMPKNRDAAPATGEPAIAAESDENYKAQDVRIEIAQMVRIIARAKNEIAAISQPATDDDRLNRASNELDAIVIATETATDDILKANEEIGTLVDAIAARYPNDSEITTNAEQVAEHLIRIFEACGFQDITGQRITKVVNTLQFIQDRILAMIGIWGVEAFEDLPVSNPSKGEQDDERTLLNGPQLENEGITQEEINALFS